MKSGDGTTGDGDEEKRKPGGCPFGGQVQSRGVNHRPHDEQSEGQKNKRRHQLVRIEQISGLQQDPHR
jgi:hypothetical protein